MKLKKISLSRITVILFIVYVLISGFTFYCAADNSKTFTVGFDAEFPPYGYKDESGEYVGFDLDLAEEVCNRKGWILKKQPIDWNSKDKIGRASCRERV